MRAAIALDTWKIGIFDRHLTEAGFTYSVAGKISESITVLHVETENLLGLAPIVKAANAEAQSIHRG